MENTNNAPTASTEVAMAAESPRLSSPRSLPASAGIDWIKQGWAIFVKEPIPWVVSTVVIFAISLALGFIIPALGNFLGNIVVIMLLGGLMMTVDQVRRGGAMTVGGLFSGFQSQTMPLAITGLLYAIASIVLIVIGFIMAAVFIGTAGGLGAIFGGGKGAGIGLLAGLGVGSILIVLVLLALSVPVMMAFWFAPSLVGIDKLEPMEAIKLSFAGCLENIVPFLVYGVIFLILCILGSIPLLLGLLIVVPLVFTSTYAAYRSIYYGD